MTFPPGSPPEAYQPVRDSLNTVVHTFETLYNGLIYGDAALSVTKDAVISDGRISELLFEHGCAVLSGEDQCVAPGHSWHPRVSMGLDNMVIFFVRSARRLARAEPADLTPMNPDFAFVVRARRGALLLFSKACDRLAALGPTRRPEIAASC